MKKHKLNQLFIDELRTNPIIGSACRKLNVSRQTYYQWRKDIPGFAKKADEAQAEGDSLLSDGAESVVARGIQDNDLNAAKFYLVHRNPKYRRVLRTYRSEEDLSYLIPDKVKLKKFEQDWFNCDKQDIQEVKTENIEYTIKLAPMPIPEKLETTEDAETKALKAYGNN
ncbi:MAG: hypothetical protein NTU81_00395 [Candidatus Nomurabacteria bacterium]|nr:hypothetical protein [Candidatus Nomurabacteria bacterium]